MSPSSSGPPAFTSPVDRSLGPAWHHPLHRVSARKIFGCQISVRLGAVASRLSRASRASPSIPGLAVRRRKSFFGRRPQTLTVGSGQFADGPTGNLGNDPPSSRREPQPSTLLRRKRRRKTFTSIRKSHGPLGGPFAFRRPALLIYDEIEEKFHQPGARC